MIPSSFDYEVAESADHAVSLLGEKPDAKLIAGGHSLLPAMKLRLARPSTLVDISRLSELSYIREDGDRIAIGALTRHHDIHHNALLQAQCPIVSYTAGLIGDPQVRHRGTIGGSLSHGDPASDLPAVIVALDAELVVRGAAGDRTVPANQFFTTVFQCAVGPEEILTEIRVPKLGSAGWSYVKMSRRAQDWATVAVAVVVEKSNGSLGKAAIGLTNMGGTPLRAKAAEEAIAGGASIEEAVRMIPQGTSPPSDHAASSDFRLHLSTVLGRRALEEAAAR